MKSKFFSKAVIYLLVTTIALPLWFLSGLFTQTVKAASPAITVYEKITNDTTPALTGTVSDATADQITVYVESVGYNNALNGVGTISVVGGIWTLANNKISPALTENIYDIVASAVTGEGAIIDSTLGELTIDLTAPEVESVTSTILDGYYNTGDGIDITVSFSEKVTLSGGNLEVRLNSGPLAKADIAPFFELSSSSGTYTISGGDNVADLDATSLALGSGAALKDIAGNDIGVPIIIPSPNIASSSEIVVDTTLPIAPTSISAVTNSPSATISWNAGSDANLDGYKVYRSDDGFVTSISGLLPTTQFSYTDTTFPATGTYSYKVASVDKAGNEAISVESNSVSIYLEVPGTPVVTVTEKSDKVINVAFSGIGGGVEKYEIYVNGIFAGPEITVVGDDTGVAYLRDISVIDYGTYNVYVKAIGMSGETSSVVKSITLAKASIPAKVVKAVAGPVETPVSVAPESATAAEPTDEGTALDEQGKILGDENADAEEEEDINWTPWIILFILIVLAGAATGGYFYWFSGEEEIEEATEVKEKKPAKATPKKETPAPKKPRRW